MTTYLAMNVPIHDPAMRHEIGEAIGDPMIFIDKDGHRILVGSSLERAIFEKREDVVDEYLNFEELGADELWRDESFPVEQFWAEMTLRAVKRVGVDKVIVPATFRAGVADRLRDGGIDLVIDDDSWASRRRSKTPWELEGIERAQRAADTAMLTAGRMLRDAEPTAKGLLRYEGEILTAEWIRDTMSKELLTQGAESEEILVQTGDQCLSGHELGSGPILPDQSCIIDCFPCDRRTGVYTDMTRTFVPGRPSDELSRLFGHVCEAHKIALEHCKPGLSDAHAAVAEYFHSNGFPTKDHAEPGQILMHGFFHSLGHGVGLDVHERPRLGRRPEPLQEGDVIAIEPGLYFPGVGGVRLEDTVLVTESGPEFFTDPLPYDLNP
jgi:Xaa-Pro aminopeptidase